MKRKIEDYIGQKVAVECSSKEEWQKILDLVGKSTATNYFDKSCNKCIALDDITSYWSVSSKQDIISNGYTIYLASDFLQAEEDLKTQQETATQIKDSHTFLVQLAEELF